jgi:hypothetical protein
MNKDDVNFLKLMVSVAIILFFVFCTVIFAGRLAVTLADYLASIIL